MECPKYKCQEVLQKRHFQGAFCWVIPLQRVPSYGHHVLVNSTICSTAFYIYHSFPPIFVSGSLSIDLVQNMVKMATRFHGMVTLVLRTSITSNFHQPIGSALPSPFTNIEHFTPILLILSIFCWL